MTMPLMRVEGHLSDYYDLKDLIRPYLDRVVDVSNNIKQMYLYPEQISKITYYITFIVNDDLPF